MNEMVDELEQAVRDILELEAARFEVPADLAARTLSAARRGSARDRARPRRAWMVAAAAAAVVALGAVGAVVGNGDTKSPASQANSAVARPASDRASFGNAIGGLSVQSSVSGDLASGTATEGAAGGASAPRLTAAPAPQIARTAEIAVQVDRGQFADKWRAANDIASQHGGFVVDSSATTVRGQLATGHLTARVPVAHLDELIHDLRALGTPTRVNEAGRDVSPQLVDYDARIRNAQAQETQLLQLLSGARTARAVADLQAQLDATRGEIESLQGDRAKVQAQVDYATVEATVTEPLNAPKPEPKGSWNKALHRAADGIVADVTGIVVVLGYAAPFVLLAAIVWQSRRLWRRRALER